MIGRSCARCRASFLLTPLREGRRAALYAEEGAYTISTHAPAGGATITAPVPVPTFYISTHAPAGGATRRRRRLHTDAADFYSRPCGRGDRGGRTSRDTRPGFLLTPLREGRRTIDGGLCEECRFLLTPLREGRPASGTISVHVSLFLLTPLREGRRVRNGERGCAPLDFYSRPCGRGDKIVIVYGRGKSTISTHAPAGGATRQDLCGHGVGQFLLTPLREGRPPSACRLRRPPYFYSRPCGRGDAVDGERYGTEIYFYSRPCGRGDSWWRARRGRTSCDFYSRPCGRGDAQGAGHGRAEARISTHAPAGGATFWIPSSTKPTIFLLTPLREGRLERTKAMYSGVFYISTHAPAGGATHRRAAHPKAQALISTHAPAGGATNRRTQPAARKPISTHAPAGGATTVPFSVTAFRSPFLLTPLREGRLRSRVVLSAVV